MITSQLKAAARAGTETGLRQTSQAVVDKVVTVARERVGAVLGAPDAAPMQEAERRLAVFRASILPGVSIPSRGAQQRWI